MKLELKHLAGYLPYGLKIKWSDSKELWGICYCSETDYEEMLYPFSILIHCMNTQDLDSLNWKPILRPLSDLMKENVHDFNEGTINYVIDNGLSSELEYDMWQFLYENHYDIHGLIPAGLAIDINTLDK
jgi:hypothetical protein